MRSETKKRIKRILAALAAATAAVGMSCLVACDDKPAPKPEYPFDDTDIIQKDYDHVVTIIGTKTQTVYLKTGETLEADRPTNIPKKSGERFVGWFADGSETEYDWTTPVTADMTIRAKFEEVEGLKVANGVAFPMTDGGIVTGSNDTLALVGTFESGSFSCDVTPVNEDNDCGVVFGVKAPEAENFWEDEGDTSYYVVLINKDGYLLFASVNPWTEVAPGVELSDYDPAKTYNIKIGYDADDGYCSVFVDDAQLMSVDLGALAGTGVGYRAHIAGTVFGEMSFDPEAPARPSTGVGDYTVRNGSFKLNDDGSIESAVGSSLAILTDKAQSDRLSFTMTLDGDNSESGIVFGLTDTDDREYYEQDYTSYYLFFIGQGGNARLARFAGAWNEPFGANVKVDSADGVYRLEVLIDGNKFDCYVNGVKCFTVTDPNKLAGTAYGIRAQRSGVRYVENDVAEKHAVIVDGANVALQFVADGEAAARPDDPSRDGYRFEGWFVGDSQTEYDWTAPVTGDLTITARFGDDVTVDFTTPSGTAEEIDGGYKSTAAQTLILTKETFTQGSLTATVKPGTPNDCGIVFGIDPTKANAFEDTEYFTVLLNTNGTLFLSAIPWNIIKETPIAGFNAANEYTLTVKYNAADGYCTVSVNGTEMLAATIASLYGNGLGYRSAAAGVEFGDFAVDPADVPTRPSKEVGEYTVRCGSYALDGADGKIRSGSGAALAVLTNESMTDRISITMSDYTGGDNGIVFGLTDNDHDEYWENNGESYYFFFITNGNARLARITNGAWSQVFEVSGFYNESGTYKLEAIIDRTAKTIACFVNGRCASVYTDENMFEGTAFGLRSGTPVEYEFTDVSGMHYVTITENTNTTLQFVADGGTVARPANDPVLGGMTFVGWRGGNGTDTTDFVWENAITADVEIVAVFSEIQGIPYRIINGDFDDSGDMYKATQSSGGALMILNGTEFAEGSLEAVIKPTTRNDCGLIFGANVPENGADWENFDYFTVLINDNGTILFSRVNGWAVIASSPVLEQAYGGGESFPANNDYKVKVEYKDGYAKVYAAMTGDEYMLAATAYIGALKGNTVGFRAAAANTEFGKTVTVDGTAAPGMNAAAAYDGTLIQHHGRDGARSGLTTANGMHTTIDNDTIVMTDTVFENGGSVSIKININNVSGDNGVIFGLPPELDATFWETYTYYFFFINNAGEVRLGRTNGWGEPFFYPVGNGPIDKSVDHIMTVSWDGNGVACFVDGVMYGAGDALKISGGRFGVRTQSGGVSFGEITYVKY